MFSSTVVSVCSIYWCIEMVGKIGLFVYNISCLEHYESCKSYRHS
jgi:hypothetical protein